MKRGAKAQQNDQADGESSHWSLSKTVKFLPRIFKNKPHRLKDGESVAQMFVMSDHQTHGRQTRVANTTTKATYLDQPEGSSVGQGLY